jgi:predicted  nucleic acid-binding Zn-ribbon protein
MHNLLTTLALIALIGSGVLGFMNRNNAENAAAVKIKAEENVEKGKKNLEKRETETDGVKGDLVTAEEELKGYQAESQTLSTQIDAKETELEEVESSKSDVTAELDMLKEEIADIGQLETIAEELSVLEAENVKLASNLSGLTNALESSNTQANNLQGSIDQISESIKMQSEGKVPEGFASSISQVYPEWGFVVVGAGNQQRAAEDAILSVRRGGVEIGKIQITELFQNRSVADVVRGSLANGVSIQAGDRVDAAN